MQSIRVYERDTDQLFLRLFRTRLDVRLRLTKLAVGTSYSSSATISGQVRHAQSPGSIDIVVEFKPGPVLIIENKIDAYYSITRDGQGQPERYRKTVGVYRRDRRDAFSVLLAPESYISASRFASSFDQTIAYESFGDLLEAADKSLLERAIAQAASPYEPLPNAKSGKFFGAMRHLIEEWYPDLHMKHDPSPDGIRPTDSRTIYFDTTRTLRRHNSVARPRMSLQCWDSSAKAASAKITLGNGAMIVNRLRAPQCLVDIGGYMRPAGRSLGIVIDTPYLDTQKPFSDQQDDVIDAVEAVLRLQKWWNDNGAMLKAWNGLITDTQKSTSEATSS